MSASDLVRLRDCMIEYGCLVDEVAEAMNCLPSNSRAYRILESAVLDGFARLYPEKKTES